MDLNRYFYWIFTLIGISQDMVLRWFNIDEQRRPLDIAIKEFEHIQRAAGKIITSADYDRLTAEFATRSPFTLETLELIYNQYYFNIKYHGLGLKDIEGICIFISIIRFVILALRYNIKCSFLITATSAFCGWLWWFRIFEAAHSYKEYTYLSRYTEQLSVDAAQTGKILRGKIFVSDYNIRLTNPVGILIHAINRSSEVNSHRIDPLSMLFSWISKLSNKWILPIFPRVHNFYEKYVEGTYYLLYRNWIARGVKIGLKIAKQFTAYALYMFVVRVNKKHCPYLIRWHWTLAIMMQFLENNIICLMHRIMIYREMHVLPKLDVGIMKTPHPDIVFEASMLKYFGLTIMLSHFAFLFFTLMHAIWGQYFYLPFITDNIELHMGPRNKNSIYSGGLTAWQDSKGLTQGVFRTQLWFGWFGRGTDNPNDLIPTFIRYIKRFLLNIIKFLSKLIGVRRK